MCDTQKKKKKKKREAQEMSPTSLNRRGKRVKRKEGSKHKKKRSRNEDAHARREVDALYQVRRVDTTDGEERRDTQRGREGVGSTIREEMCYTDIYECVCMWKAVHTYYEHRLSSAFLAKPKKREREEPKRERRKRVKAQPGRRHIKKKRDREGGVKKS